MGRLGRGLVAMQVALACGALLLTTTFVGAAGALRSVVIPFPSDRVLTAQLGVAADTLDDAARRTQLLASSANVWTARLKSSGPRSSACCRDEARVDGPCDSRSSVPEATSASDRNDRRDA